MLITVSQDGRQADFEKLQEAIDSIAAGGDGQAGTLVAAADGGRRRGLTGSFQYWKAGIRRLIDREKTMRKKISIATTQMVPMRAVSNKISVAG